MAGPGADLTASAAGYLIGSVPIGLLAGKAIRGLDVREYGSGNIGTTNVYRILGPTAAALTFALDVGKGAGAVLVARRLGADPTGQAAAGVAAVIGHSWPVFAKFRGGKGVATSFGALLLVTPETTVYAVVGGVSALLLTRIVSVGSLSAAISAMLGATVHVIRTSDPIPLAFSAAASALIAYRHADNLKRLIRGQEPRFSWRKHSNQTA
jgi:glycerol-3-phosphate acyltransferase PlsY